MSRKPSPATVLRHEREKRLSLERRVAELWRQLVEAQTNLAAANRDAERWWRVAESLLVKTGSDNESNGSKDSRAGHSGDASQGEATT